MKRLALMCLALSACEQPKYRWVVTDPAGARECMLAASNSFTFCAACSSRECAEAIGAGHWEAVTK